jgi:hypothetical protein
MGSSAFPAGLQGGLGGAPMFVTVNRLIGFYLDLKRKRLKENRFVGLRTEALVSRIGNDQEQIPMNVFTVMPFSGPATQI